MARHLTLLATSRLSFYHWGLAGSWFYCKFTNTMSFNVIIYISLNLTGIGSPTFSNTYILSSKNLRGFPPFT